jgi:nicotinamide-nucleotide amidase
MATACAKEAPAMSFRTELAALAKRALELAQEGRLSIVTAESCTAGKLAVLLSEVPGAAAHLEGGFVTYTKANKTKALGVPAYLLQRHGAVCCEVAAAMAEGALQRSPANLAVAITGVAGPAPDEDGNPVGRVCLAVAGIGRETDATEQNYGNPGRERVQEQAMADALHALIRAAAQTDKARD